jgi:RNA polymerase sigma-70 factor (ECF subfamily)
MGEAERVWRERGLRAAVLAGDERAWQTWYDGSFVALDAYAVWRCGGLRDLADDVLQETWLTAVRRVRQFDPARGSFVSWLCGIAANVARNQVRRRKIRSMPSLNGDTAARSNHQGQRVAHALAGLPEHYERVLRQKYLDRQSVAEIAAEWSDTEKAIESLLTRARAAFREAYGPED